MAIVWFPSIPIMEYSDKTLLNWKKKELIAYIRQLEHSVKNLDERLDIQARNMSKYEPVVHAHWIEDDDGVHCSNCKRDAPLEVFTYSFHTESDLWEGDVEFHKSMFCPNCGAIMDEEVE